MKSFITTYKRMKKEGIKSKYKILRRIYLFHGVKGLKKYIGTGLITDDEIVEIKAYIESTISFYDVYGHMLTFAAIMISILTACDQAIQAVGDKQIVDNYMLLIGVIIAACYILMVIVACMNKAAYIRFLSIVKDIL